MDEHDYHYRRTHSGRSQREDEELAEEGLQQCPYCDDKFDTLLFCASCGDEACDECAKDKGWNVIDSERYCPGCI